MGIFSKRAPEVVRRGEAGQVVEERKTRRVGRQKVEVRRVTQVAPPEPPPTEKPRAKQGRTQHDRRKQRDRAGTQTSRTRDTAVEEEIIIPVESARKQMLVRVKPHQTQVVILEGPVLVEHYVAKADQTSLVGNIYLGKVRNVLPGMEAAFIDFGASKNGVVYASDVKVDPAVHGKRKPRIEEVLKEGDEVLVQVVKDAMGAKGARLTGLPSLPGRYLVLVPDSDAQGISRRLPDTERQRLRQTIAQVKPEGFGVIVRTAALHATAEEIAADIHRLTKAWQHIQESAIGGGAPRVVYEEPDLLIRVIREHFTADFRRMLIDDTKANEKVLSYLRATAPDLVSKVAMYEDEMGLFERYHVEDQLRKALDRRVYLPSGGHLVIDRTEALTVIDVNTGKFVGSSSLEETVLHNNLEAAEEIGRQLRLRDIGGIIVIDFIDMEIEDHQRQVLRRLKETLARDKTRTQVFEVSHLGLVEMTRKNVAKGLLETFSEPCQHCDGRGVLLHEEAATHAAPVGIGDEDVE
ncbi:MAG: Rne/Rng family ribonuclease [Acidimicrobiia bacterium]|nr:Rne/Rng family ribonuclease [Acidimicrobiia bacterium]MDH4309791.1 Rne/Rng family ribonuclease [Acidimicrobiia bacterium]MDH5521101.1 Rne/Rng family ribonuclease [Acidimicrobiia bacterium]